MTIADKALRAKQDLIDVSNASYEAGNVDGYDEGYNSGYYDSDVFLWSTYQNSGKRTNYNGAFMGVGWTEDNFFPIYDMKPTTAFYMFAYGTIRIDLAERLEGQRIKLDFSQCTNHTYLFYDTDFTRIGEIDLTKSTANSTSLFTNSPYLETIDLVRVHPTIRRTYKDAFKGCTKLKHIRIDNEFRASQNFGDCPLDLESAIDVIQHLVSLWNVEIEDSEGNWVTQEYTETIVFSPTTWGYLDSPEGLARLQEEYPDMDYSDWRNAIDSEYGWNYA